MKKNITINMFGTLYAIDEDACKLLESYLDNMKSYFSKREGGDEIADDIEHRVAEILSDLKLQGVEAISVDHVQTLIRRIGNPEEMDDEAGSQAPDAQAEGQGNGAEASRQAPHASGAEAQDASWFSRRKLFRDPDDVMLGGVMSGICKYFGGTDPLPYRILMVLLALFSFSTIGVLYLLAWAIVPQAQTAEERLQMCGKPVNPESIKEEVMRTADGAKAYMQSPQFRKGARGFCDTLLNILLLMVKAVAVLVVTAMLVSALFLGSMLAVLTFGSMDWVTQSGMPGVDLAQAMQASPALAWQLWATFVFALVFLGILFYGLLRWMLGGSSSYSASPWRKVVLAVIAVVSLGASLGLGGLAGAGYDQVQRNLRRLQNTQNGVFLMQSDRDELANMGWNILTYKNCNDNGYCVSGRQSWDDEDESVDVLEFEKGKGRESMQVLLERTESLPAGYYRLRTIGWSKGQNAFTYVKIRNAAGAEQLQANMIPSKATGEAGNLKRMSLSELQQNGLVDTTLTDQNWNEDCREALDDWSWVDGPVFYHAGGNVTLGITNMPILVGRDAMQPGSNDFVVRQVKLVPAQKPVASDRM